MVIGVLQFELLIHGAESLKDKRRVVQSVKDRLHREHQVAVAEVRAHDTLNLAILALACIATEGSRVGEVLDAVTNKLRALGDAELGDTYRQILRGEDLPEAPEAPASEGAAGLEQELLDYYRGGPAGGEAR